MPYRLPRYSLRTISNIQMRNIKLTIEFDGTEFVGWQIQPGGLRTVQGVMTEAISRFISAGVGGDVKVTGVGRTDSGVHARAYVLNFPTNANIPTEGFVKGLNAELPDDVFVKSAEDVPLEFNARRDAKKKTYLYRIVNSGHRRSPLERNRAWSVEDPLDIELMKEAAAVLVGKKDFTSFCAAGSCVSTFVREIFSFTVKDLGDGLIELEVSGSGFLKYMVRIMVGNIVMVGAGKLTIDELRIIIEARDREVASITAPSQGLYFKEVEY